MNADDDDSGGVGEGFEDDDGVGCESTSFIIIRLRMQRDNASEAPRVELSQSRALAMMGLVSQLLISFLLQLQSSSINLLHFVCIQFGRCCRQSSRHCHPFNPFRCVSLHCCRRWCRRHHRHHPSLSENK